MALPVAAIVSIVLACWVILVLILFGVYKFLKYRGSCDCECAPCGKEGGENTCCKSLSESCNCCNPSLQGCLNSACPKKKISCVDIILCQCCAEPGQDSCLVNVLQYIICCPFKVVAECCMVHDEDDNLVTKWSLQNQSFCRWMCSSVKCNKPECCQPSAVCCSCKGGNSCQNECCCKNCCQGLSDCQCLSFREHFNSLWLYLKKIFCCKCAKNDENSTCSMFREKCSQCVNCDCCKCESPSCECPSCACSLGEISCIDLCNDDDSTSCVCTQPTKCPTYQVEFSSRMNLVATGPACPENILCFSCSETEAVRCCCHYLFLNRCGDPKFNYDEDKKDICICYGDSCCTFLLELMLWMCQVSCISCFTTCENCVFCCCSSGIACFEMCTCQCSDIDLLSSFGCLCFDCERLDESNHGADETSTSEHTDNENVKDSVVEETQDAADEDVDVTECGCFRFKNCCFSFPGPEESVESDDDSGYTLFTSPDGKQIMIPNDVSEDMISRFCMDSARSNSTPSMVMSMPNFERTSRRNLHVHRTASLPNREYVPDENYEQNRHGYYNSHQRNSRIMTDRSSMRRASHDDYSDDEYYDVEDQSMADNRRINRLQKQFLNDEVYYEHERDIDSHRSASSYTPRKHRSSMSHRQTSLNDYPASHSGILKTHSKNNHDRDHEERNDSRRGRKHAHFQDDDPELYGELFPRQHSHGYLETNIDEESFVGEHTARRKRFHRQSNFDRSKDFSDSNSDEYAKPTRHKKNRRKPYSRDPESSDDNSYVDIQPSTSNSSRRHRGRHDYDARGKSQEYIEMKRSQKRSSPKNRHHVTEVPKLNLESDDEVSDDRHAGASSKHRKSQQDRERRSDHRRRRDYEEENDVGSNGNDRDSTEDTENVSRKKSVAERMKELRERNTKSESD